jgi:hypothetical protein
VSEGRFDALSLTTDRKEGTSPDEVFEISKQYRYAREEARSWFMTTVSNIAVFGDGSDSMGGLISFQDWGKKIQFYFTIFHIRSSRSKSVLRGQWLVG